MNEKALESFMDTCDEMMVPVQEGVGGFFAGMVAAPYILAGLVVLSYSISNSISKSKHKKELKKTGAKKFLLELENNLKKFEVMNQKALDEIKKYKCAMAPKGYFTKLVERKKEVNSKGDIIISSALAIAKELETSFDISIFTKCNTQKEAIELVYETNKKIVSIREKIQLLENRANELINDKIILPTEKTEVEEIPINELLDYFTVDMEKIKNLSFAYKTERNHMYSEVLYREGIWEFTNESNLALKWINNGDYTIWMKELNISGIAGCLDNISRCVESVNYILTDLEKCYSEPIDYAAKLKYVKNK